MIGTTLADRYEVTGRLGRGGMGVVYRARDLRLRREVAVKVLSPTALAPEAEERFVREAHLVAQMDHPAVVPIYDVGWHEESLFFVMPVVAGTTMQTLIRQRGLELGETLEIVAQVAEALDYSHLRGVVHRDVKPENIMVSRKEAQRRLRVRIMDFGLALGATASRLTKSGNLAGTMNYLSPEQILAVDVDGRSDLYSLGTILYESLVGELPFSGARTTLLFQIVNEDPPDPARSGLAEPLAGIILSCLAKEPDERPQRGNELAARLRSHGSRLAEQERRRPMPQVPAPGVRDRKPAVLPFVGRSDELAKLRRRLDEAVAGECRFVLIGGEAGMGKTRLLRELEQLARERRVPVLRGHCSDEERVLPYQGFGELVQDYFRKKETGSSLSQPADLHDLWPELEALFPVLHEISALRAAGATEGTRNGLLLEAGIDSDRTRIFELLARTLARLAASKPAVFMIEHLHGAGASIEALQYIVHRLGPTPTLIVGTYRQTEISKGHPLVRMLKGFQDDPRSSSLLLEALRPGEHRELLTSLLGSSRLLGSEQVAPDLAERLYEASEGNPLFTRELIRSLLDTGEVARDDTGVWVLSGDTAIFTDVVPETIQQAVEARLERLPEALLRILTAASILGKSFDLQDIETLVDDGDTGDEVDRLVREGLLEEDRRPHGDRLHFSSGVVRDVLYGELSRSRRRSLHRRHAEQLEARYAGRRQRVYSRLVHHFAAADVPAKTVEYARKLARVSLDTGGWEAAIWAIRTALDFVADEDVDAGIEGELRGLLAAALRAVGNSEAALKEAAKATQALLRAGKPDAAAGAALTAAETAWHAREVDETRRWVEKGVELARTAAGSGDSETADPESATLRETRRRLLLLCATLANLQGEYARARTCQEEAEGLIPAPTRPADEPLPVGGTLTTALAHPLTTLDPGTFETVEDAEVLANVFETLLESDAGGHLTPGLCEQWEGSDDGRSFRLTLHAGIRFSNGRPLRAEDVKRSLERSAARSGPHVAAAAAAIRGMEEYLTGEGSHAPGIEVLDERAIRFHLVGPMPFFPALLTDFRTAVRLVGDEQVLLGTGPFRIATHDRDRVVLLRNPKYWRGPPPPLERLEFRTSLDAAGIASGLRTGQLDVGRDLLPADLDEILRDPRFRFGLVEATQKNIYFVYFNGRGPMARHREIRRALSGVVRTRDLVWRTLGRFAQPATCLIPPGILGHDPGRRPLELSREQAAELLQSAGLRPPVRLIAAIHPLFFDRYSALLKALLDEWSGLGVEVMIETSSIETYLARWQDNDAIDLLIGRWVPDYDDPDNVTYMPFHTRHGHLGGGLTSNRADPLLERARQETDAATRQALYRQVEALLAEQSAVLPLFHDIDYRIASPRIRGLRFLSSPPYVSYSEIAKVPRSRATPEVALGKQSGGTIYVPLPAAFESLDPALAYFVEPAEVVPNVFETLTRVDESARIVPGLAAELRSEASGRRFRFRLRDDLYFHDGRKLTVRDVRYSFERLLRTTRSGSEVALLPIRGARAFRNGESSEIDGFSIVSATELVLDLEQPLAFYPAMLTRQTTAIVPEGTTYFAGSWRDGCAGTGPFRVVRFASGERIELEANPHYRQDGYPKCGRLIFELGLTPGQVVADFRAGKLSIASNLRPADAEALLKEPEFAARYREAPGFSTYYLLFNTRHGPFADPDTRRAFVRALDVKTIARATLGRLAIPAEGLLPPGLLGYEARPRHPAPAAAAIERNFAGLELTVSLHPAYGGSHAPFWDTFREACGALGATILDTHRTVGEMVELDLVARKSADLVANR
ncbi:MAG: protein kinase, partial [bacterium]|nr:protein kinase [bacterium]